MFEARRAQKRAAELIASLRGPLNRGFDNARGAFRPYARAGWNNPGFYLRAVDRLFARSFNTVREASEPWSRLGFIDQLGILEIIPRFDRAQRAMVCHVTLQRRDRNIAQVNRVVVRPVG